MSTTKRIPDLYTIISPSVIIEGNLFVTGNSQSIVSNNTAINDHLIILNDGLSPGVGPNPLGANIIVDRGTSANVSLAWNESIQSWQISNDGIHSYNIATIGGGVGGAIANVYADPSPAISSNLDLHGNAIYDSINSSGNVQIKIGAVGPGGTGIRVTNTQYVDREVMLKARSIAYSILFG